MMTMIRPAGYAIAALMLIYTVWLSLFGSTAFVDELYNHGLVLRSALETAQYPLETSYMHWYFTAIEIVRAEDWHRSPHLIGFAALHRAMPETADSIIAALNLAMIFAYLTLIFSAARALVADGSLDLARNALVAAATGTAFIVFAPWFAPTIANDYLDDLPSTLFAMSGFLVFVLFGLQKPYVSIVVGVLIGIAAVLKDFAIIYLPCALLACLLIGLFERRFFAMIISGIGITLGFAVMIAPKLMWNLGELGMVLPDQARVALNGRLLDVYDGEHQIYFAKAALDVPLSWMHTARETGFGNVLYWGVRLTGRAVLQNWQIFAVALPMAFFVIWTRRQGRQSDRVMRLVMVITAVAAGVVAFFSLRLGEPAQLRYWMTTLGLCAVLISCGVGTLLQTLRQDTPSAGARVALGLVCVVLLASAVRSLPEGFEIATRDKASLGYPAETLAQLEELAEQGPVMLHTAEGGFLWRHAPQAEIISVKPGVLVRMQPDEFQTFLDAYPVAGAAYKPGDRGWRIENTFSDPLAEDAVAFLLMHGFCKISEGKWTVLKAPNSCDN